jgi:lipid-A-disaccharide synthase
MHSSLLYLIAGEASGDALGAGLMHALRGKRAEVQFAGIGGEAMEVEGLQSLFPYRELSLMGFLEIIPHIPALFRRLRQSVEDIAQKQPDVIVTIDSPGFNFRLAGMLKKDKRTRHIKRLHYVAPSVWAYKPERAKKTAQLFDGLLTLLPFEPSYFKKEGLQTFFVGHPVLWDTWQGNAGAFRMRHAIGNDVPVILLLPGSRAGEIRHHLALFLEAAGALNNITPVVLASPQVKEQICDAVPPDTVIADIAEKRDAFAAATFALSKSGTITLELVAAGVPMVVAHRGNPLSAWLIRRMILIKYASLVNIAAEKEIVPELLQERCNLSYITAALKALESSAAVQHQKEECKTALRKLRGNNVESPHSVAAQVVLGYLAQNSGCK